MKMVMMRVVPDLRKFVPDLRKLWSTKTMSIKDITSAVGLASSTQIDAINTLEEKISELDSIIADPRGFLTKHKWAVAAQSQVHVTVIRRPAAPALVAPTHILIIRAHYTNCDTVIVVLVF